MRQPVSKLCMNGQKPFRLERDMEDKRTLGEKLGTKPSQYQTPLGIALSQDDGDEPLPGEV